MLTEKDCRVKNMLVLFNAYRDYLQSSSDSDIYCKDIIYYNTDYVWKDLVFMFDCTDSYYDFSTGAITYLVSPEYWFIEWLIKKNRINFTKVYDHLLVKIYDDYYLTELLSDNLTTDIKMQFVYSLFIVCNCPLDILVDIIE